MFSWPHFWTGIALLYVSSAHGQSLRWEPNTGYRAAAISPKLPGKTGFTLLNASQTGIQFTNTLSVDSMARNHNLMQGAGVAAGDFDGDGLCDLYFCNVEGRNALYRNVGSFRFEDVTDRAGVLCPGMFSTGAVFADVDGDGRLDLIVSANNTSPALFINQGDGRFTNATVAAGLTARPLGSTSMALADLNGDGSLDLFVANYGENTILRSGGEVSYRMVNGQPVVSGRAARRYKIINGRIIEFGEPSAVYLNDGKGKFTPLSWTGGTFLDEDGKVLKEAPMDLSLSVAMRDINGDRVPDIYVCNDFQTPDRIWINDGAARFRALPRLAVRQTSHFSMGVDFADIDRDGREDFVVVDMLSRKHGLRMTQMVETNLAPQTPGEVENRPQIRRNTLFWNRGDGTYAELANFAGLAASDWSWTPAFLDVDLDGFEDLLVSNGHAFDTQDLDVGNKPAGKGPEAARRHLLQFPKLETPNYAFRNRGDLTFEEAGATWGFDSKQVCHGLIFADLDNDGDLDAILSSLNAPPLVYRNETAAPRVTIKLKGKAPNTRGIGATIEVTGGAVLWQSQQMVCGGRYLSADEPVRTFAAGSLTNRMTIAVTWRNGTRSIIRDALPNHVYELEEANASSAPLSNPPVAGAALFKDVSSLLSHKHHEESFDDFGRQPLLPRKHSQAGPGIAWFDFEGDGAEELIIGSGRGGALSIFRTTGQGTFARNDVAGVSDDDLLGMAGWAKDGARALLMARAGYETSGAGALLFGTSAAGSFNVTSQAVRNQTSPGALAVADLNGDGTLEIFVGGRINPARYPESAPSQILRIENRKLAVDITNTAVLAKAGLVNGAVWSDLDADGLPELVLACEWGPIRVFKNTAGQLRDTTAELKLDTFTGLWTSVTTADLDGDGRLEIIAGNWGLNSSYSATAQAPLRMYAGDLNGDGSLPLIEAELESTSNKIVPRENLTVLAPAMPFLRARFPTHVSFAQASAQEILGEQFRLARELRVTTLASTIFWNRGDRFEPMPLPREAQWAPVHGLSIADANGDGAVDVFLAQNFFATRVDVPRLDAGRGLWLRNYGKGHLRAMAPAESGVLMWGEQRGCAVADYDADGRVDLAVAQNGGETKLYRNEKARVGLRVRLQGTRDNPDGIGATIRVKYADGLGPAHELHGGDGYLSQSSAVCVLGMRGTPTFVTVRWPGGKFVEKPVPAGAREIIVRFED